jgi:hypothetical protein
MGLDALPGGFDLTSRDQHLSSKKERAAATPPAQIRVI